MSTPALVEQCRGLMDLSLKNPEESWSVPDSKVLQLLAEMEKAGSELHEARSTLNAIVKFLACAHPEIPFTGDVPQYVQRVVRSLQDRAQQPDVTDLQWLADKRI